MWETVKEEICGITEGTELVNREMKEMLFSEEAMCSKCIRDSGGDGGTAEWRPWATE